MATATDQSDRPPVAHASFAALRHPGFQMYFLGTAAAMLADNIEHVISGRVIGVFSMAANGMRTFSGLTVGMLGGLTGIHGSLSLSAAVLCVVLANGGRNRSPARPRA